MKVFIPAVLALAATLACGPRQVAVQTGAQPTTEVMLRVTNNLSQAINVYVANAPGTTSDLFLRQIGADSVQAMTIPGLQAGVVVTLKATTADGARTYTRDSVALSGTYEWQVP